MDDARFDRDVIQVGDAALAGIEGIDQFLAMKARIVVNVQGAYARGDIDDSAQIRGTHLLLERMDAEPQVEIENVVAVFHQQVAVTIGTANNCRSAVG